MTLALFLFVHLIGPRSIISIGIALLDFQQVFKTNEYIRQLTKVTDIREQVTQMKWNFAGHVTWMKDNRWNIKII